MTTTRTAPSHCLACGRKVDAATDAFGDSKPSPGDITVCIECGHLMAFDHELKLRALTDQEMKDVAGSANVLTLQWARGKLGKGKGRA